MWGVEFHKAKNSMICGYAEFEVRSRDKSGRQQTKQYRVRFGPHDGMTIDVPDGNDGWKALKERAEPEDLEAILPQGDFLHNWTYSDFMIAFTFWGDGQDTGYQRGRWDGMREARRKFEAEAARE